MHDDPQAVANGMVTDVEYAGGALSLVSPPVMFDSEPARATRAPEFGEHTDEVLTAAGYPAEVITKMRESGIVA
jgi:crotonobetainyl-CoA:carnitine CoA-transferase CaiB-like acyl-CoA transferase